MYQNEAPTKNLNKGYASESNSQEKFNLDNDNPVAKDASGGRSGSFMSKHCCDMSQLSPIKHCGPGHK